MAGHARAAGLAALLCLAAGCGEPRDGRALLERAATATAAATALRYDYVYQGSGRLAGTYRGTVVLVAREGRSRLRVTLTGTHGAGEAAQPIDLTVVSDGESVARFDAVRGLFFRGTVSGGGKHLLGPVGFAVPPPFAASPAVASFPRTEGDRAVRDGATEADGLPCDVVRGRSEELGGAEVSWTLARGDGLPRAQRWVLEGPGAAGGFELGFERVATDFEVDPADFSLAAPDGIPVIDEDRRTVGVGDAAPDWTLAAGDGGRITLSALRDEVVVLLFRSGWCAECPGLLEALRGPARERAGRPVRWLVLDAWDAAYPDPGPERGEAPGGFEVLRRAESVAPWFKLAAPPAVFVVDRTGSIALARRRGEIDPARIAAETGAAIDRALRD